MEHQPGLLSLPAAVIINVISPLLSPKDLIRLLTVNQHLHILLGNDSVWSPLCLARGWNTPVGYTCLKYFSQRQRVLCVHCQRPAQHVFKLLGCRLCDRCETQSTRYALVTTLEATQRYGLPAEDLKQLPYVWSCGIALYLRDAVLSLLQQRDGEHQGSSDDSDSSEEGEEEEEGGEEEAARGVRQQEREDGEEGGEVAGMSDGGEGEEEDERSAQRAEQRAARKAAKKQAKEDQRIKREARASGFMTTKNRRALTRSGAAQQTYGSNEANGGGRGGGRRNKGRPKVTGVRQSSVLQQAFLPEGSSTHMLVVGGGSHGHRPNRSKVKSEWLEERERLMREYGEFSLSGLVLAE